MFHVIGVSHVKDYWNVLESFETNKVLSIYQGSPRSLWEKMKLRSRKPSPEKNPD